LQRDGKETKRRIKEARIELNKLKFHVIKLETDLQVDGIYVANLAEQVGNPPNP